MRFAILIGLVILSDALKKEERCQSYESFIGVIVAIAIIMDVIEFVTTVIN